MSETGRHFASRTTVFHPRVVLATITNEISDGIARRNTRHDGTTRREVTKVTFFQKKGKDEAVIRSETECETERESVNLDGEVRPSTNVEVNLLFGGPSDSLELR